MIELLSTVFDIVSFYIAMTIVSCVVLLVLGTSTRDIPEEVFIMALLWPVTVPIWIGELFWYRYKQA